MARLLEVVAARDAEIARLRGRVAELERQLGQNSTNSHEPPSSDPPGTRPSKEASGRKRGGQAGHTSRLITTSRPTLSANTSMATTTPSAGTRGAGGSFIDYESPIEFELKRHIAAMAA